MKLGDWVQVCDKGKESSFIARVIEERDDEVEVLGIYNDVPYIANIKDVVKLKTATFVGRKQISEFK